MTEKMIRDAYCRIRTIDQTIPDDVLDFMKDAALEKLRKHAVSNSIATEYAEFCVRCDREGLPLLCLEDYIKQYCC